MNYFSPSQIEAAHQRGHDHAMTLRKSGEFLGIDADHIASQWYPAAAVELQSACAKGIRSGWRQMPRLAHLTEPQKLVIRYRSVDTTPDRHAGMGWLSHVRISIVTTNEFWTITGPSNAIEQHLNAVHAANDLDLYSVVSIDHAIAGAR